MIQLRIPGPITDFSHQQKNLAVLALHIKWSCIAQSPNEMLTRILYPLCHVEPKFPKACDSDLHCMKTPKWTSMVDKTSCSIWEKQKSDVMLQYFSSTKKKKMACFIQEWMIFILPWAEQETKEIKSILLKSYYYWTSVLKCSVMSIVPHEFPVFIFPLALKE